MVTAAVAAMSHEERFEVIVVGAGIAGVSVAYFLARRGVGRIVVVEREDQPAYHASGRSAGALVEHNPNPHLSRLITRGAAFLRTPPAGFAPQPLLDPAGVLLPASAAAWDQLRREGVALQARGVAVTELSADAARERVPALRPQWVAGALWLGADGHLDPHEILWDYLRGVRAHGGELRLGVRAWAGLRTVSPDELPVVGEDPRLPGFFWLAGQGGVGIETSPVLGRLAADLLVGRPVDPDDAMRFGPARFGDG